MNMLIKLFSRIIFVLYFMLLSWQLLTPVTIISAGGWDKLYHMVSFAILAGLAILAWRNFSTKVIAITLLSYAALTEILQHFIPGRSFSVLDWFADGLGIALAIIITVSLLKRLKILGISYG